MAYWEYAEYTFAGLVAVACFGEYIADFTRWWNRSGVWSHLGPLEDRKDKLAKLSTLLLIIALVGETLCLFRTNQISGTLLGSLDELAAAADAKAKTALGNSTTAITQSGLAKTTAEVASKAANEAQRAASIAKRDTDAVSRKAKEIDADLDAVRLAVSSRSIQDTEGLKKDLAREYKGRLIAFKSYAGDSDNESFALCITLMALSQEAGVNTRNGCATEPRTSVLQTDLEIMATSTAAAGRLGDILKKPRRVSGFSITLRAYEGPEMIVLVGAKPRLPLWPKTVVKKPPKATGPTIKAK